MPLCQTVQRKVDNPNNADIMSPTSIVACNDRPKPGGHSIVCPVVGLLTHRLEHLLPSHRRRYFQTESTDADNGLPLEEASIATISLQRFTAAGPSRNCLQAQAENAPEFPVHETRRFQSSSPRTGKKITSLLLLSNKFSTTTGPKSGCRRDFEEWACDSGS